MPYIIGHEYSIVWIVVNARLVPSAYEVKEAEPLYSCSEPEYIKASDV